MHTLFHNFMIHCKKTPLTNQLGVMICNLHGNLAHMAQFEPMKLHHYNILLYTKQCFNVGARKGMNLLEIKIFYFQVCV